MRRTWVRRWRELSPSRVRALAVVLGGAVGAVARWRISLALPNDPASFPWGTLIVNTTGAFGLGFAAVILNERMRPSRYLRPLIAIGFFGAYTTFSTMAVEGIRAIDDGAPRTAIVYWVVTLLAGQAAGVYGMWTARFGPVQERGDR